MFYGGKKNNELVLMAQSLNSSHVYQQAGTFYNFAIPKSSQHRIEGSRSPRL